ncbi:MAG: twin-arginine translocation signal domain-containing protein [Gammaproteobacteria bacterium]
MKDSHDSKRPVSEQRRNFLRDAAAGGGAVAVAAALPGAALADDGEQPTAKKEEGYRLTKHIADYYKSTV